MNKLRIVLKRRLVCISLVFIFFHVSAQQIPLITQYRDAISILNPGAIGADFFSDGYKGSVGLIQRKQWAELPNAPSTQILRGDYYAADRYGVTLMAGGHLINDQTGPTGLTGVYGKISGIVTSDAAYNGLSMGLSIGAVQYRLRAADLKLRDPDDIRAQEDRSKTHPDLALGVFYYQRLSGNLDDDYIYAGLSMPQALAFDVTFTDQDNRQFSTQRVRHYFANAGWYHFFGDESFIEPSVWLKYVPNTPFNADFNLRYRMRNTLWLGLGASVGGNIHAEFGVQLGKNLGFSNNVRIGYGFDYSGQKFGVYTGSTHEISLCYAFGSIK
jgi:type IX secretion system PorP/SprF family membrane protein